MHIKILEDQASEIEQLRKLLSEKDSVIYQLTGELKQNK